MLWQVVSIFGALLILTAYAAHQTKRMHGEMVLYQVLNLIGGICLCATAVVERQYGFILMEGAWALMSAWGLMKVLRS